MRHIRQVGAVNTECWQFCVESKEAECGLLKPGRALSPSAMASVSMSVQVPADSSFRARYQPEAISDVALVWNLDL